MLNCAVSLLPPLRAELRHGDAVVSYVKLCLAAVNWALFCNYSTWQQNYQDKLCRVMRRIVPLKLAEHTLIIKFPDI